MNEENKPGLTLSKIAKAVIVGGPIITAAALSQLDPHTAAIWAASTMSLQLMSPSDRKIFATEFSNSKTAIAEEILYSEEFVRAFKITIEAASKTRSEEKIKLIARLLHSGTERGAINDFDAFKEYVDIADSLSPRELTALATFDRFLEVKSGDDFETVYTRKYGTLLSATYPKPLPGDPKLLC